MTGILSNVKSALRRGSDSNPNSNSNTNAASDNGNVNTLSPEYSQKANNSSADNASTSDQNTLHTVTSSSSSIDDLKKHPDDSSFDLSTTDGGAKSKKQLKAEEKAREDAELKELAAAARQKGDQMNLDPLYLPNEFKNRGLAYNSMVGSFGK
ncbi:uncharacterized protein I303_108665 [Kwoniella dejecticola CBS 10117]|uniref:Uncharacterized protein n=1 Tax=Kwoniella dejecticola CBS 10117 TaxID=1296121 RepID=A0A1A5ZWS0_9TREE|nr:uncharacterized protein I303_07010 [Kwoniella dejecticola CBS 10117]OBR82251.1 hypothetical protein I303_07010 [Kwoniella dejecticola CBS 10117]